MKEKWKKVFHELHGKHYNGRPAARRLAAFVTAVALVTTLAAAQVPGIAYALTGDDAFDTGYEELLNLDVGNYYYDTYGTDERENPAVDVERPADQEQEPQDEVTNPDDKKEEESTEKSDSTEDNPTGDGQQESGTTGSDNEKQDGTDIGESGGTETPDAGETGTTGGEAGSGEGTTTPDPDKEEPGSGDGDIIDVTRGFDLKDSITKVTMQWRKNQSDSWHDIDQGTGALDYGAEIQFTLEYTIQEKALWPNGENSSSYTTIYYNLPKALENFKYSGEITDADKNILAYYSVADGVVTITELNDDKCLLANQNVSLSGDVSFSGKVSDLKADEDGMVDLPFIDQKDFELTVKPKPVELEVKKTQVVNEDKTAIQYTVTVSSTEGTGENRITLKDELSSSGTGINKNFIQVGASYSQSTLGLKVYKETEEVKEKTETADGWSLKELTSEGRNSSFMLDLPPLGAGESYTISYQCDIANADKLRDAFEIKNTATAVSGDGKASAPSKYTVTGLIHKNGSPVGNHQILWTITVNEIHADMKGMRLTDYLNDVKLPENTKVTMTVNSQEPGYQVTIPYTFGSQNEDTTGKYTFTYTTLDTPEAAGTNQAVNQAYLIEPSSSSDKSPVRSTGKVNVTETLGGNYSKTALCVTENDDSSTITLNWALHLQPAHALSAGWTLKDTPDNGQYLTEEQQKELENTLRERLTAAGYTGGFTLTATGKDANGNWTGFLVTGDSNWINAPNYTLDINYSTTRDRDLGQVKNYTFNNQAVFDNFVMNAQNYYHEGTVVQKVDVSVGKVTQGDSTEHEYHTLTKDSSGNYLLKWNVVVTLSEKLKQDPNGFTITETLPVGTKLAGLTLKKGSYFSKDVKFSTADEASGIWTADGGQLSAIQNGDVVTLTIPQSYYTNSSKHNETMTLEVAVLPTDTDKWQHDRTYSFTNTVTVSNKNLPADENKASQTQDIFNNENHNAILKEGFPEEGAKNQVRYKIVVNPDAKQYPSETGYLRLTDTMDAPKGTTLFLMDDKLAVYDYTDGVKGQKLTADEYSYTYEEKDGKSVLTFLVPNERTLLVEYVYRIQGKAQNYTLNNSAVLEGTSSKGTSSGSEMNFKVQESSASIKANGITLYKVDSTNNGKRLAGAVFDLQQWNVQTCTWDALLTDLTSASDGKIETKDENGNNVLKTGVAYRLIEKKAPHGYHLLEEPFDFYIDTQPQNSPADFNGRLCRTGDRVFVPNTPGYAIPQLSKKIVENGQLVDHNTAKPGETVQFQTTLQVAHGQPSGYVLYDTMSGLTFDAASLKIIHSVTAEDGTMTEQELQPEAYTLTTKESGSGFALCLNDELLIPGDKLTLTYSASVNKDAATGETGNLNTAWVEYDGMTDPDKSQTITYVPVPKTDVIAGATSGFDLYKYTISFNGDEKPLADAKFVLYRQLGETKLYAQLDSSGKAAGWTPNEADATVVITPENGLLHFEGLPAGAYCLQETEAPLNYERLTEPVRVVLKQLADCSFVLSSGNAVVADGVVRVENRYTKVPVTPLEPSDEVPSSSESSSDSSTSSEPAASSEQPASSDSSSSGELPASPDDAAKPGTPGPDNQDGWVLGEYGADSNSAKPGAPTPDNTKGWVLGANGLIQTGQLNWPIPVLIALGGALVLAGVYLIRKSKKHQDK